MILSPLLNLGALQANLALRADRLSLLCSLLVLALIFAAARAVPERGPGRLPLLLLSLTALLGLLSDDLLVLCAAFGLSRALIGVAGRGGVSDTAAGPRRRALARGGGDLALFLGAALLFWSLGGTWSRSGRFLPDHDPERPLPEIRLGAAARHLGPTLSLSEVEGQLAWRGEGGGLERPITEALRGKRLLGQPLLAVVGACLLCAAAARAVLARRVGGFLGGLLLLQGLYLLLRLRGLLGLAPPLQTALLCAVLTAAAFAAATVASSLGRIARFTERLLCPAAGRNRVSSGASEEADDEDAHHGDGDRGGDRGPLVRLLPVAGQVGAAVTFALIAAHLIVALRAGGGAWLLPALVLSPLLAALPLDARRLGGSLAWLGALLPGVLVALVLHRFDADHGVRDGDYGVQLTTHLLLHSPVELTLGIDGLAAGLLPLCAVAAALALARAPDHRRRAPLAVLAAATFAVLLSLDAVLLALAFLVMLDAAARFLEESGAPGRRAARGLRRLGGASALCLCLCLALAYRVSLPAVLADGTHAAGSVGLIPLGYLNYYGDQGLLGFPLSKVLFCLALIAAAAPAALVPVHGWLAEALAATPTAACLALLLRAAAFSVLLRVGYGLAPDAAVAAAPLVTALGTAIALHGALCLRSDDDPALRRAHVFACTGGLCLLGAASFTLTGLAGLLLLLVGQLALCLHPRPAPAGLAASPATAALAPASRSTPWLSTALPLLLAPAGLGGLGWGAALVLIGALPGARLQALLGAIAALLLSERVLAASWASAASSARKAPPEPGASLRPSPRGLFGASPPRLVTLLSTVAIVLLLIATLFPAALLSVAKVALRDLLTHTSGHLGAAALAWLRGS